MSSTLVAGRVDTDVSKRAQFYIKRHGTTQADVIRNVWQKISDTGIVPVDDDCKSENNNKLKAELAELQQVAPKTELLKNLSPQDLKEELSKRG